MLKVRVREKENRLEIKMEGHADYAEAGKDIVCSACSILLFTLLEELQKQQATGKVKITVLEMEESGRCRMEITDWAKETEVVLETIFNGYKIIEKNFPKNISFVAKIGSCKKNKLI
ncbi:MAG: ribosomal-processing cysteine protease Prp [Lachnospiraceae bacterium]|jgi:uncharacterized protein YsxB (DUF464 family)|nr:ribosomal-processing cysteine protease Prp [Lachnospiraceae bacterium]